jgi:hypothetical protein
MDQKQKPEELGLPKNTPDGARHGLKPANPAETKQQRVDLPWFCLPRGAHSRTRKAFRKTFLLEELFFYGLKICQANS